MTSLIDAMLRGLDRIERVPPVPPVRQSVAHCGGACEDLVYMICDSCESPVKGKDCCGWSGCLDRYASTADAPCALCEVMAK
jgi:hypothetical protein